MLIYNFEDKLLNFIKANAYKQLTSTEIARELNSYTAQVRYYLIKLINKYPNNLIVISNKKPLKIQWIPYTKV